MRVVVLVAIPSASCRARNQALSQELPAGLAAVALNRGIIDTEMLQSTFGNSSSNFPDPATWAENAVPFLEKLGPRDNGKALTAPQG